MLLVGRSVVRSVGRSVGWLVGWLVGFAPYQHAISRHVSWTLLQTNQNPCPWDGTEGREWVDTLRLRIGTDVLHTVCVCVYTLVATRLHRLLLCSGPCFVMADGCVLIQFGRGRQVPLVETALLLLLLVVVVVVGVVVVVVVVVSSLGLFICLYRYIKLFWDLLGLLCACRLGTRETRLTRHPS